MNGKIKISLTFFLVLIVAYLIANNNQNSIVSYAKTSEPLIVFAGASLTDVLSVMIDSFEVNQNVTVQINLASSGTLVRQIEQGATPDIYISANKRWVDYLDSLGLIVQPYKTEIAKNELVLIAPVSSTLNNVGIDENMDFVSLLSEGRLSIGDPAHVPAGQYAKQSLEYFGWFNKIEGKLLPAKDVRSAMMVSELGEVPAAIVYRTDAMKSSKIKIIGTFPETSHKPITYVASICKKSPMAEAFYDFLNSEETKAIWESFGFIK